MSDASTTPEALLAWRHDLERALPAANIPTLLMVLVHLTGDLDWLSETYQCSRIRGLDENDSGGLPEAVQARVRAAALEAILAWKAGAPLPCQPPTRRFSWTCCISPWTNRSRQATDR
ncbi:hypothetical protein [Verticiella alkaliphila]|uniref:hypothetical protein n=1 Tax=Verticiella alkaliphila TaxID=2779529 RepID=UPI001C0E615F|nr:hypothetical protein [Verticiella sp. GG226]